ncbi:MAG: PDZ domain-containing protein, partial [Candidatus Latescibacterota bacterium]
DLKQGLDIKVKSGVLISEVIEGSPAEAAGIEDGDVVIEFNGEKVDSPSALRDLVAEVEAGETVNVKVFRDNRVKTYEVTIGEWPEEVSWNVIAPEHMVWFDKGKDLFVSSFGRGRLGVHVTELNEDLAPYFDAKEGDGVLVTDVVDESAAEEMGIKAGDVIVKVGTEDIGSKEELIDAVGDVDPGDPIEVTVLRKSKRVTLEGEMPETLASTYVKALRAYPHRMRMPDVYKFSDDELEDLKREMEELKKEMEEMRKELKKVERKTR